MDDDAGGGVVGQTEGDVMEDEYCGYPHGDCVVWAQLKASKPRAVVAISEDRQWLVTHEPPNTLRYKFPDESCFYVWQRNGAMGAGIEMRPVDAIADTGQDAHEVLATFLRERSE